MAVVLVFVVVTVLVIVVVVTAADVVTVVVVDLDDIIVTGVLCRRLFMTEGTAVLQDRASLPQARSAGCRL